LAHGPEEKKARLGCKSGLGMAPPLLGQRSCVRPIRGIPTPMPSRPEIMNRHVVRQRLLLRCNKIRPLVAPLMRYKP